MFIKNIKDMKVFSSLSWDDLLVIRLKNFVTSPQIDNVQKEISVLELPCKVIILEHDVELEIRSN
jgi:hypothetical protein